jgi:YfiH family protein
MSDHRLGSAYHHSQRMQALLQTATVPALAALPGLVHGFEQRLGPAGESREAGRDRVAAALGPSGRLLVLSQVHGAAVCEAPWEGRPEADAAVAAARGFILGIETADCLPALIVDPVRRTVAAAHAGWRGTAAGVAGRAAAALLSAGSRAEDLIAALGPAIGPCCYEVGEEVRAAFGPGGEAFFRDGVRGRANLDLRSANRQQLLEAGLAADRIHDVADCTRCRGDLYHSYRRDGRGAGRMLNFVGWALL